MCKLTVAAILALALIPGIASAQFYGIDFWDDEPVDPNALRVRAGWFDMGDFGSGFGAGLDYRFRAFGQTWLAGGEWGDGEYGPSGAKTAVDVFGAHFNWIGTERIGANSWYYGAGLGWYFLENGLSDDGLGFQILGGMNHGENLSFDVRYVWADEFSTARNANGLRLSVGYWFK